MPSDHFKSLPLLKVWEINHPCRDITVISSTLTGRPLFRDSGLLLFDSFYWPKNWQGIWRTGTEKVSFVGCFLYPAELMAARKKKKTTGFPNQKRHQADFSGDSGRHSFKRPAASRKWTLRKWWWGGGPESATQTNIKLRISETKRWELENLQPTNSRVPCISLATFKSLHLVLLPIQEAARSAAADYASKTKFTAH